VSDAIFEVSFSAKIYSRLNRRKLKKSEQKEKTHKNTRKKDTLEGVSNK
jgi:hypothetical protein